MVTRQTWSPGRHGHQAVMVTIRLTRDIRLTIAFVTALMEVIYITQIVQGLVSLSVSYTQADMVTKQTWSPSRHGHQAVMVTIRITRDMFRHLLV